MSLKGQNKPKGMEPERHSNLSMMILEELYTIRE